MPTMSYNTMLKNMVAENPNMVAEMLEGALNLILSGEVDAGRILLKNYVDVTIGFPELARRIGKDEKNLRRSLSERGNPTANNLFNIVQACASASNVTISAQVSSNQNIPA